MSIEMSIENTPTICMGWSNKITLFNPGDFIGPLRISFHSNKTNQSTEFWVEKVCRHLKVLNFYSPSPLHI